MHSIQWAGGAPVGWGLDEIPEVDDVRPNRCPGCLHPARVGSRIVLHGHGVRTRGVVVAPASGCGPRLRECWCRRYRCTQCGAVTTVLPVGVMPRYLYSVLAIVLAFTLVAEEPVGQGLTDTLAYKRQGMNRLRRWHRGFDWRWRSLDRWKARVPNWWPGLPDTLEGLLIGLRHRAGGTDPPALLAAAIASHVRWGATV